MKLYSKVDVLELFNEAVEDTRQDLYRLIERDTTHREQNLAKLDALPEIHRQVRIKLSGEIRDNE